MCCNCCSVTQRLVWLFGLGAIFIALGVTVVVLWPDLAESIVDKNLQLVEGSSSYDSWVENPVPIYLEFNMFNWTNPEDFGNPNIKPRFEEVGPYVYLEEHYKRNITFYDNQTASYFQRRDWYFDAERSNGSEHDMLTLLHPITRTVADETRGLPKILKKIVNFMLNREGGHLYVTKPVHEWIFDGFQDDLIDFLNFFNSSSAIDMPYTKFAFMADRNQTLEYDGQYTLYTGEGDITRRGMLTRWQGNPTNGFYDAPCGTVNGTAGDTFGPYTDPEGELTVYVPDACRFLRLKPKGKITHLDVEGVEFVSTAETFDSGSNYPEQQCFCNPKHGECALTGVVDNKLCRSKAPIFASFPHFYLADETYLNAVEGLNPVQDEHEFKLTVEPRTGSPVRINGRIQLNLKIERDEDYDIYKDAQDILMPLFWFQQRSELDKDKAAQALLALNLHSYGIWAGIGLICIGGLMWSLGVLLAVVKKCKRTPAEDKELYSH